MLLAYASSISRDVGKFHTPMLLCAWNKFVFRKQELRVLKLFNDAVLPSGLFYEVASNADCTTSYDFMNDELESIWKEAIVHLWKYCPGCGLQWARPRKTSYTTAGILNEDRTKHLQNKTEVRPHYTRRPDKFPYHRTEVTTKIFSSAIWRRVVW
jgi:hypothetical protein